VARTRIAPSASQQMRALTVFAAVGGAATGSVVSVKFPLSPKFQRR
jgi:hypothetical protein